MNMPSQKAVFSKPSKPNITSNKGFIAAISRLHPNRISAKRRSRRARPWRRRTSTNMLRRDSFGVMNESRMRYFPRVGGIGLILSCTPLMLRCSMGSNFQQSPDRPDQNIARTRNAMNRISTTVGGDAPSAQRSASAPNKNLYEIGEIPTLGHVPESMYAWVVRRDRHGPPEQSMQVEVVPTWPLDSHDVLVFVMAAGGNYNGGWAALGEPLSPMDVHKSAFHVAGSDASGVVWAIGSKVKRWKVGDEVVVHCNQDDGDDEECNGGDPMFSSSQRIWGYEKPDGAFAQFCRVQDRQLMARPKHLTWEESASYTLTLATAYRMLFGHEPHRLKPSDNVLVWGASGGLGVFGVQLCAAAGANAIGVISDETKRDYVMSLGAKGVLNRKDYNCWGQLPKVNSPEYNAFMGEARKFGKAIWNITGKQDVDTVFEHPGEQTFPVSCFVVKRGGMVVFCAGTTGFNITFDARFVWMRQKRIQGSHFANLKQASAANKFVLDRRIDPCMSEVFPWTQIPLAHTKMWKNQHKPGNMAVLVNAPTTGLRTFEGVIEAARR